MGVNGVVVLEPDRQRVDDSSSVRKGRDANIVALDRAHEGLGHAIGLRAPQAPDQAYFNALLPIPAAA